MAETMELDPAIWRVIAGDGFHVPPPDSLVYYFPYGHLEHYYLYHQTDLPFDENSMFVCKVNDVKFMVSKCSDQIFSIITLSRLRETPGSPPQKGKPLLKNDDDDGVSFCILKLSRRNIRSKQLNLKLPADAESVFPDAPFEPQKLAIADTNNCLWVFTLKKTRSTGTLFLTGDKETKREFFWGKNLEAGDSLVFVKKNLSRDVFLGVRRGKPINREAMKVGVGDSLEDMVVFSQKVMGCGDLDVVYWPRGHPGGSREFVVARDKWEAAMSMEWKHTMEVRQRIDEGWRHGKIVKVWKKAWRMLDVKWDGEKREDKTCRRLNPWELDFSASDDEEATTEEA